jgi:hypothetical protein
MTNFWIRQSNYSKLKPIIEKGVFIKIDDLGDFPHGGIYKYDNPGTIGHDNLSYNDYGRVAFNFQMRALTHKGAYVELVDEYSRDHFYSEYHDFWYSEYKIEFDKEMAQKPYSQPKPRTETEILQEQLLTYGSCIYGCSTMSNGNCTCGWHQIKHNLIKKK